MSLSIFQIILTLIVLLLIFGDISQIKKRFNKFLKISKKKFRKKGN